MNIVKTTRFSDGTEDIKYSGYTLYLSRSEYMDLYRVLEAVSIEDQDKDLEKLRRRFFDQMKINPRVKFLCVELAKAF